jgi:hypothetical protein
MVLPDVNVLVYAHREDAPDHERYRDWMLARVNGAEAYGLADIVLSGFLRVVTHPRVFTRPTPLETAMEFIEAVRSQPHCVSIAPGARHWEIFATLCRSASVKGNYVPDAYLAALAIESGSEWATTDRGFARFPGLRWHHPLD